VTPSLLTIARRAFAGETKLPRGAKVLLAVSGGPDSMALLDVCARLELDAVACGVDHGLRKEAGRELDLAEAHATHLAVPFTRVRVAVAAGGNVQERARTARWKALAAEARKKKARFVATAHHADDRAETLLLRLLRGAGLRGLAVLGPRAPVPGARALEALRPLLRARRSDVLAHLERHSIAFATDPSNQDPRFTRVRVRNDLLPLLEELDPNVVRHLERIADELLAQREPRKAPHWTDGLSRPTQEAIHSLLLRKKLSARVWLPGGLVLRIEERARK
jgi:tRNA(Ile)-lysidine synthase